MPTTREQENAKKRSKAAAAAQTTNEDAGNVFLTLNEQLALLRQAGMPVDENGKPDLQQWRKKRKADTTVIETLGPNSGGKVTKFQKQTQEAFIYQQQKEAKANGKDEMVRHIKKANKMNGWRQVKFAHGEEAQVMLAELCFEGIDMVGEVTEDDKKRFVIAYKNICVQESNHLRGYVQQCLKGICDDYMDQNQGKMPSIDDLVACLTRNLDMNKKADYELFEWYVTKLIPKAAGNRYDWNAEKYEYMTLSEAHHPGNTKKKLVTPSTEAIAVAMVENNEVRWPEIWKVRKKTCYKNCKNFVSNQVIVYDDKDPTKLAYETKKKEDDPKTVLLNGPKFQGKYTMGDAGQVHGTGWTKQGRKRFYALTKMNKDARKSDRGKAMEKAYLEKYKELNGLTAYKSHKEKLAAKRRANRNQAREEQELLEEEQDMEWDDDDDEE